MQDCAHFLFPMNFNVRSFAIVRECFTWYKKYECHYLIVIVADHCLFQTIRTVM